MYYIVSEWIDWADEFEYPIISILNEEEYEKYKFLREKFKDDGLTISFYFGTNEGWDDFDPFNYLFKEISLETKLIIEKYSNITCNILELAIEAVLEEICDDNEWSKINQIKYRLMKMPLEQFKEEINKLYDNEYEK